MAWLASFGKCFGKKKLFKINEMPFMTQIVKQKWHGRDFSKQEKKKESVTEM